MKKTKQDVAVTTEFVKAGRRWSIGLTQGSVGHDEFPPMTSTRTPVSGSPQRLP